MNLGRRLEYCNIISILFLSRNQKSSSLIENFINFDSGKFLPDEWKVFHV